MIIIESAVRRNAQITIPAGVLAQAWRGHNVAIARLLQASEVEAFDKSLAKTVGRVLATSKTSDVIDAAVIIGAAQRRDMVLTSDVSDLNVLSNALGSDIKIVGV